MKTSLHFNRVVIWITRNRSLQIISNRATCYTTSNLHESTVIVLRFLCDLYLQNFKLREPFALSIK